MKLNQSKREELTQKLYLIQELKRAFPKHLQTGDNNIYSIFSDEWLVENILGKEFLNGIKK